jgi:hypothetical protein
MSECEALAEFIHGGMMGWNNLVGDGKLIH